MLCIISVHIGIGSCTIHGITILVNILLKGFSYLLYSPLYLYDDIVAKCLREQYFSVYPCYGYNQSFPACMDLIKDLQTTKLRWLRILGVVYPRHLEVGVL